MFLELSIYWADCSLLYASSSAGLLLFQGQIFSNFYFFIVLNFSFNSCQYLLLSLLSYSTLIPFSVYLLFKNIYSLPKIRINRFSYNFLLLLFSQPLLLIISPLLYDFSFLECTGHFEDFLSQFFLLSLPLVLNSLLLVLEIFKHFFLLNSLNSFFFQLSCLLFCFITSSYWFFPEFCFITLIELLKLIPLLLNFLLQLLTQILIRTPPHSPALFGVWHMTLWMVKWLKFVKKSLIDLGEMELHYFF